MLVVNTKYHGTLDYTEDAVIEFPAGLFGFPQETRFLALEQPAARPIVFLQSLADPSLCFVTLPVLVMDAVYSLAIPADDLRALGLPENQQPQIGTDVLALALITIKEQQPTTANLLAPLIVNLATLRGVQSIALGSGYSHQHPFLYPLEMAVCS